MTENRVGFLAGALLLTKSALIKSVLDETLVIRAYWARWYYPVPASDVVSEDYRSVDERLNGEAIVWQAIVRCQGLIAAHGPVALVERRETDRAGLPVGVSRPSLLTSIAAYLFRRRPVG